MTYTKTKNIGASLQNRKKNVFYSSAYFFVPPALPPPPLLQPPTLSNFPEDGGACLPGTWHWFPSALGNNLRAVARTTRIYLFTFLHIASEFFFFSHPPHSPSFFTAPATAHRATGRQMLSGRWVACGEVEVEGRCGVIAVVGWVAIEERDGWPCQARTGWAVGTLAWNVCASIRCGGGLMMSPPWGGDVGGWGQQEGGTIKYKSTDTDGLLLPN